MDANCVPLVSSRGLCVKFALYITPLWWEGVGTHNAGHAKCKYQLPNLIQNQAVLGFQIVNSLLSGSY